MKALLTIALFAFTAVGCVTFPHSTMLQQTAAPLREGVAEVGVGASGGYAEVNTSSGTASSSSLASYGAPRVEGNFAYGLSDIFGLNLHLSPAGLQPGVKITLVHGSVDLSILPSISFGVIGTQTGGAGMTSSSSTEWLFLAGVRGIVSIPIGLYAGAGYDFTYLANSGSSGGGTAAVLSTNSTLHTFAFALGYRLAAGPVRIYVEADPYVSPAGTQQGSPGTATSNLTDWGFLVGVTLAVNSGGAPLAPH